MRFTFTDISKILPAMKKTLRTIMKPTENIDQKNGQRAFKLSIRFLIWIILFSVQNQQFQIACFR